MRMTMEWTQLFCSPSHVLEQEVATSHRDTLDFKRRAMSIDSGLSSDVQFFLLHRLFLNEMLRDQDFPLDAKDDIRLFLKRLEFLSPTFDVPDARRVFADFYGQQWPEAERKEVASRFAAQNIAGARYHFRLIRGNHELFEFARTVISKTNGDQQRVLLFAELLELLGKVVPAYFRTVGG